MDTILDVVRDIVIPTVLDKIESGGSMGAPLNWDTEIGADWDVAHGADWDVSID